MKLQTCLVLFLLISAPALGLDKGSFVQGSDITKRTVLTQMNFYRGLHGLHPLKADDRLVAAAADRMRDMEELEYWSHNSPDGRGPFGWLGEQGYMFRVAGENLAAGFETAEILVASWMESPGHRRNILSPDFNEVGIAIIEGATNRRSTGKSIVVLFASERVSVTRVNKSASTDLPPAPTD